FCFIYMLATVMIYTLSLHDALPILGAELLDRSVKPPRLNSLGSKVLEQARDLLQRTEALKSLTSSDAEPHGLLRIGLAHALAEGDRKSTRLNSSHVSISYAVFCLKK